MGKYTIFADVGKTLVNMLRDQMVPQPVSKPELIGMCSPNERGSFILGIHPYDIKEEEGGKDYAPISLPDGRIKNSGTAYQFFYIISISSKAELMDRAVDEQRIMGRLMQVINDNRVLPLEYMPSALRLTNDEISIDMVSIDLDEKSKIWGMFNEPYKLSLFYVIRPIVLESAIITSEKKRVAEVGIGSKFLQ